MSKIILNYQDLTPLHEELEKQGYQGQVKDLLLLLQKQTFQSQRRFFYEFYLNKVNNRKAQQWIAHLLSYAHKHFEHIYIGSLSYDSDNHDVYLHLSVSEPKCKKAYKIKNLYLDGFAHKKGYAIRCVIEMGARKEREKTFFFAQSSKI
jgi:exopolyphosphatase/pppGpp-phosphohydrolase